jgi:hypothetical protein
MKRAAATRNKFVSAGQVLSRSEINEILLLQVVTGVGRETSSTRPRSDVWNYFGCLYKAAADNLNNAANATGSTSAAAANSMTAENQRLQKVGDNNRLYCS